MIGYVTGGRPYTEAVAAPPYLDERLHFHFAAFGQSFYLHLADGTHVEMVHRWAASKAEEEVKITSQIKENIERADHLMMS